MSAVVIDGRAVAEEMRAEIRLRAQALRARGISPRLVVSLVGEDASSLAYVRSLVKVGEKVEVDVDVDALGADASEADVAARLGALGGDPRVHGVILQQPLPAHLRIRRLAGAVQPDKDVDGTNPINQGRLAFGSGTVLVPATPAAVMHLLERSPAWPLAGKRACVVGRSNVVGLPVALLLLTRSATVTVTHKETTDLAHHLRDAEVVVVATGVPGLIRGEMLMPGATVIDVGTTVVDGILKGDVDFESAVDVAGAITPVPGGVGPVTNVALLRNVVKACERSLAG